MIYIKYNHKLYRNIKNGKNYPFKNYKYYKKEPFNLNYNYYLSIKLKNKSIP